MKMEKTNKHYYLFTDGIGVFKTEKPNVNDFKSSPFCESGLCKAYHDCINEWLQSGKKYPFGEGEDSKFINLTFDRQEGVSNFDNALKSGILISPERVDFDGEFEQPSGRWKRKYAKFVPIEEDKPKEESQDELLNELIKTVTGLSVPTELLIKGNGFHITRK